jgi:hypothetical protein
VDEAMAVLVSALATSVIAVEPRPSGAANDGELGGTPGTCAMRCVGTAVGHGVVVQLGCDAASLGHPGGRQRPSPRCDATAAPNPPSRADRRAAIPRVLTPRESSVTKPTGRLRPSRPPESSVTK